MTCWHPGEWQYEELERSEREQRLCSFHDQNHLELATKYLQTTLANIKGGAAEDNLKRGLFHLIFALFPDLLDEYIDKKLPNL